MIVRLEPPNGWEQFNVGHFFLLNCTEESTRHIPCHEPLNHMGRCLPQENSSYKTLLTVKSVDYLEQLGHSPMRQYHYFIILFIYLFLILFL